MFKKIKRAVYNWMISRETRVKDCQPLSTTFHSLPCGGYVIDDPEQLTIWDLKGCGPAQFCWLKHPHVDRLCIHRKSKMESFTPEMLEEINNMMIEDMDQENQIKKMTNSLKIWN